MSAYLTAEQIGQLLKPINAKRVGKDGKNFSHVEAYDIRAHLNRIFGFGRWSADVCSLELVFEAEAERTKDGKKWMAWTVCYRAVMRVSVCAQDGTPLASYEDGATGEATNQPSRGDAHDLAMKTALSQALKRAAVNLGDQFGLSLYNKGSLNALVGRTLVTDKPTCTRIDVNGVPQPIDPAEIGLPAADVDEHITEPLAAEDEQPDEPRTTTAPVDTVTDLTSKADAIRDTLQSVLADRKASAAQRTTAIGGLMKDAQRAGVLGVKVDTDHGPVAVKVLLEQALVGSRAA